MGYEGTETWLLLGWKIPSNDVPDLTVVSASPTDVPLEGWVAGIADPQDGYLRFAPDGSLSSTSPGVRILEQRHPVELKDFVLNGEPTAAALIEGLDGKKWYVVVRDIDGVEIIAVPFPAALAPRVSETASELGISEGTVKSHTSRGLTALERALLAAGQ
jgi:hypothetical protein